MKIKVGSGFERELIPAETFRAVATRLIDCGVQKGSMYGDKHQIIICWELPDITIDIDGVPMPRMISEFYNLGTTKDGEAIIGEKSTLYKHLVSWRGKPFTKEEMQSFDLKNILGVPCMLQIVHNEKNNGDIREKVYHVMPLMKGLEPPKPATEIINLDWSAPDFKETLEKIPDWQKDIVKRALNWGSTNSSKMPSTDDFKEMTDEEVEAILPF